MNVQRSIGLTELLQDVQMKHFKDHIGWRGKVKQEGNTTTTMPWLEVRRRLIAHTWFKYDPRSLETDLIRSDDLIRKLDH